MPAARRKSAKPVEEVVEELDTTDAELELDEDDEVEEEAPAPKAKKKAPAKAKAEKPAAEKIEFGSGWLAEHVNSEAGTSHTPYTLRILLRKLTAEGTLKRDESQGRARYSFTGPEDPQVKAIVEAVKSGTDEKAKQERLDALKAKRAEAKAAKPKATKKKAAKAEAVEAEAEEEDDFDDEIEDI